MVQDFDTIVLNIVGQIEEIKNAYRKFEEQLNQNQLSSRPLSSRPLSRQMTQQTSSAYSNNLTVSQEKMKQKLKAKLNKHLESLVTVFDKIASEDTYFLQ